MNDPLISILLPTHNGAQFIARSINSVLQQRYQHWELIIINDGSADTTEKVIYSFNDKRIVYIKNESNLGIQRSLNKGISIAKGQYIARIDDDDWWNDSQKLEKQLSVFESDPRYVLIGTNAFVVDTDGKVISKNVMPKTDAAIRHRILSKNCFLHSTVMFSREALLKTGYYPTSADTRHVEDYDLWLRLGLTGKVKNLEVLSTSLTLRPESLTAQNRIEQARNMLATMSRYRKTYPRFFLGYCITLLRYAFFHIAHYLPISKKLVLKVQRFYKAV